MRCTIYILMVLMALACQSKISKEDKLIDGNENLKLKREQVEDERIYITDSAYLSYDYKTVLKNGYTLEHKVYIESGSLDTLQAIVLMNGIRKIKELSEGNSYDLPHKNIGYVTADFDNSFVFVQSFGSGNPNYFQLIDKKIGEELRTGVWVDVDEEQQVLLYLA